LLTPDPVGALNGAVPPDKPSQTFDTIKSDPIITRLVPYEGFKPPKSD